jgi:hypothetical protein
MKSARQVMLELSQPFPEKFIHKNPSGGGSYIKHHVIEQRLMQVFGRPPTFERVEIVFGDVAAIPPNPQGSSKRAKEGREALKNVIVGVVARMTVEIEGEKVVVEEVGDCEQPHNWDSDGQRLKDAFSDAYKRCAMRLGCGLHLWSQDEYFLHDELKNSETAADAGALPSSARAASVPAVVSDQSQKPESAVDGEVAVPPASESWRVIERAVEQGQVKSTKVHMHAAALCTEKGEAIPQKYLDVAQCTPEILHGIATHFGLAVAA